jgi:hypothetical protein
VSILRGDGSDSYQDNQNGISARINICSGSRDATITALTSTRRIRMTFPAAIPNTSQSGQTPSWAGSEITVPFFFNVRNILCYSGSCGDPFTTRMAWQFAAADGFSYHLRFYPAVADSPDLHSPDTLTEEPDINLPYETSPVVVHHQPGNCANPGGNPIVFDRWDVTAASPSADGYMELGTLHRFPKRNRDPKLHMGQYSMPFRLQIEALQCF